MNLQSIKQKNTTFLLQLSTKTAVTAIGGAIQITLFENKVTAAVLGLTGVYAVYTAAGKNKTFSADRLAAQACTTAAVLGTVVSSIAIQALGGKQPAIAGAIFATYLSSVFTSLSEGKKGIPGVVIATALGMHSILNLQHLNNSTNLSPLLMFLPFSASNMIGQMGGGTLSCSLIGSAVALAIIAKASAPLYPVDAKTTLLSTCGIPAAVWGSYQLTKAPYLATAVAIGCLGYFLVTLQLK